VVGRQYARAQEVGQGVAREAEKMIDRSIPSGTPWSPVPVNEIRKAGAAGELDIRRSSAVKKRLWSRRDWVSWATLLVLLLYGAVPTVLVSLPYWFAKRELQETQSSLQETQSSLQETQSSLQETQSSLQKDKERLSEIKQKNRAEAFQRIKQNEPDRAREALRQIEALVKPNDVKLQGQLRYQLLQLGYRYKDGALAYQELGDLDQFDKSLELAFHTFMRVKEETPGTEENASVLAGAYNGIGNVYYLRGDYVKAVENCRRATEIDPSNAYAWHDLLLAYLALSKEGRPVDVGAVRHALEKLKETSPGQPLLGKDYLDQLEKQVEELEARKRD